MSELHNIQISKSLFDKIVGVFDYIYFSNQVLPGLLDFDGTHFALREKQHRMNLRTAYTNTILAKNEGQKHLAYENYLKLKKKTLY